jgi:DNA-binding beta-propeller fold protein YncE/mono/diheme cytochrome c family protein
MPRTRLPIDPAAFGLAVLTLAAAGTAIARSPQNSATDEQFFEEPHFFPDEEFGHVAPVGLHMLDAPIVSAKGEGHQAAGSWGGLIANFGKDVLVVDADAGAVLRVTEGSRVVASVPVAFGAGQLVVDAAASRAYVADRNRDHVLVLDLKDGMTVADRIRTSAEPFGLALTPDGSTLLVTTVADHELVAYDTGTRQRRWSVELAPEPRGVAISPDGRKALVGFLTTGAAALVDLDDRQHDVSYVALERPRAEQAFGFAGALDMPQSNVSPNGANGALAAAPRAVTPIDEREVGRSHARNAFAVAFLADDVAWVAHQVSTPLMAVGAAESSGTYGGGGFASPVEHRVAMIQTGEGGDARLARASLGLHQPRALAFDARRDVLYVAGYGSDTVMALADATKSSIHRSQEFAMTVAGNACGPEGLTVGDDGVVHVFCSLTHAVATIDTKDAVDGTPLVRHSTALASSQLSAEAQLGKEIFRRGNDPALSAAGGLACASCHAEGRSDGLSWRIEGHTLQTPFLAGRLVGTHPFKWDGKDADLPTSLRNTVQRLGGGGIQEREAKALQAFLTSLPAPRPPRPEDKTAVERGKTLFFSAETGCGDCHAGARHTDGNQYTIAPELGEVDTPSLVGLAHSAPYYHDGSAPTLHALLEERGRVHGMGKTDHLSTSQIDDLVAYLETL